MSYLPLQVQEALEERIAFLSSQSLNLGGDPMGADDRPRVQTQHWIAYQGSNYPDGPPTAGGRHVQERVLEFQSYVEVQDLRRDYQRALELHEILMGAIAGFRPDVPGVLAPVRVTDDAVISARANGSTVYRYRATYQVRCNWVPALFGTGAYPEIPSLLPPPFTPQRLEGAIFRSPLARVGEPPPVSTKDADFDVEEVGNET